MSSAAICVLSTINNSSHFVGREAVDPHEIHHLYTRSARLISTVYNSLSFRHLVVSNSM